MALDPIDFFYRDGTVTLTNGSDIMQGTFTAWDPAVLPYDFVFINGGQNGVSAVKEVLAVNQIRLAEPWTGPTLTDVPYLIMRWIKHTDPRIYGVRVSDYLTRLKDIPTDIEDARDNALAQIGGLVGAAVALRDTKAAAAVANIPSSALYLRTAGYAVVGDGGGALYKKIPAPAPVAVWHFQSADGAWWELAEATPNALMFGVKGDGVADDTAILQALTAYTKPIVFPPGLYTTTQQINFKRDTKWIGAGSWDGLSSDETGNAGGPMNYRSLLRPYAHSIIQYTGLANFSGAVVNISPRLNIVGDQADPPAGGNWFASMDTVQFENFVIDCGYKAGFGVFTMYLGTHCRVANIVTLAAARYGVYGNAMYGAHIVNIRALFCRTGISFGDNTFVPGESGFSSMAACRLEGLWVYKCGVSDQGVYGQNPAYREYFNDSDPVNAPGKIREGCGIYLKLAFANLVTMLSSEYNDGAGLVLEGSGEANDIRGIYLENNGGTVGQGTDGAANKGRASKPWGIYCLHGNGFHGMKVSVVTCYDMWIKLQAPGPVAVDPDRSRIVFEQINFGPNSGVSADHGHYEMRDLPKASRGYALIGQPAHYQRQILAESQVYYSNTAAVGLMRQWTLPAYALFRDYQEVLVIVDGRILGTTGDKYIRLTDASTGAGNTYGDIWIGANETGRFQIQYRILSTGPSLQKIIITGLVGARPFSILGGAGLNGALPQTWQLYASSLPAGSNIEIDNIKVYTQG